MKRKRKSPDNYNLDELKRYMSLSAREKLNYLEKLNAFLSKAMSTKSKRAWEKLKKQGW